MEIVLFFVLDPFAIITLISLFTFFLVVWYKKLILVSVQPSIKFIKNPPITTVEIVENEGVVQKV